MSIEDDDDFLNAARRERGALPAGEYVAEIVPGSVKAFETSQTVGCTVGVKICKGDYCDREIRLRFLEDGSCVSRWHDRSRHRGSGLLAEGCRRRAIPATGRVGGVLKAIWKASKGKNVLLRLTTKTGKDGVIETILVSARCDDDA